MIPLAHEIPELKLRKSHSATVQTLHPSSVERSETSCF